MNRLVTRLVRRLQLARAPHEEGSILAITLLFLLLFALFVPALLGQTSSSFQATFALRDQHNQVYAAEGAIYAATQQIRGQGGLGAQNTPCPTVPTPKMNDYPTRVLCEPAPGSGSTATNRPQYNLLALPPASDNAKEGVSDSPTNGAGAGVADIYVGGNVASNGYVERVGNSNSGHFYIDGSAVALTGCQGRNIVSNPDCTTTSTPFADPSYSVGAAHAPGAAQSPTCLSNAAEFFPGTYTSAPVAPGACTNKTWWFSPGLYYFDFTTGGEHVWTVTHTVIGGTPNPASYDPNGATAAPTTMPGACKGDYDVTPNAGVQWVFGADTHLAVTSGDLELCPTPSASSQEIAIYGYGGGNATSPGQVGPSALAPTTNTISGSVTFVNPMRAYQINEGAPSTADATLGSNDTATLKINGFTGLPAGSSIESATLTIRHLETTSDVNISAAVTGTGITEQDYPQATSGCTATTNPTGQLCQSSPTTMHADTFDLTPQLGVTPSALSSLAISFTAATKKNKAGIERLDGVELDVTYAPPGDFRRQSGCVALALQVGSDGTCDFIGNPGMSGSMYVNGTLYAPLGRLDIVTDSADTVQFNRGVVARDIIAEIPPGNESSHSFGFGKPDRYAYLTAQVLVNGSWMDRTKALVAFNDETFGTPGTSVAFLQWRDIR